MDKLMENWIKKRATIIVDESFLDFTDFKSVARYIDRYDRVYIIKSMTKFYASAGIRVGFIASNYKNILNIKQKEPLWKISQFDSQYIQSALRDRDFPIKSKKINNLNREKVINILKNSDLIDEIYPSCVNFVMVRLKNINAKKFQEKFIPYKIMIRDCYNFDYLNDNFVRIAIKNNKSIDRLKEALCEIST
jgi:threonine-phosphate decarboxylase